MNKPMTHGVFADDIFVRPFTSEGEADRFATQHNFTVHPITWIEDPAFLSGGRFIRTDRKVLRYCYREGCGKPFNEEFASHEARCPECRKHDEEEN